MFNDGGAVVALSQTRHYVAAAFRNHRIALYETSHADVTLQVTQFFDIAEELGVHGLIRSLWATDTDLYVGTITGNEGIIILSAWLTKILKTSPSLE